MEVQIKRCLCVGRRKFLGKDFERVFDVIYNGGCRVAVFVGGDVFVAGCICIFCCCCLKGYYVVGFVRCGFIVEEGG